MLLGFSSDAMVIFWFLPPGMLIGISHRWKAEFFHLDSSNVICVCEDCHVYEFCDLMPWLILLLKMKMSWPQNIRIFPMSWLSHAMAFHWPRHKKLTTVLELWWENVCKENEMLGIVYTSPQNMNWAECWK